jgi:D-glycero-alpha-D-manno-heptose-7-phosphate kinase
VSQQQPTTIRASAPVRLDLAGGWTDVPPFSEREGGVVVNAAIQLQAHAEVTLGGRGFRLEARDLGCREVIASAEGLVASGPLGLLKAALRMYPVGPCTLETRVDAPPGSGLGSSGALDVALVSALSAARGERLDRLEIAEEAWRLETVEAGIAGGRQDQLAAALGGFNLLRFHDPELHHERLDLDPAFRDELERRTVLCYTGTSRVSGDTITRVMTAYRRGDAVVTGALRGLREVALLMAEALRGADLARVADLLSRNWKHQQALDSIMQTTEMKRLEALMTGAGVLGGKAAGSGAGGCMFFLAGADIAAAQAAAREAGVKPLPVRWSLEGASAC